MSRFVTALLISAAAFAANSSAFADEPVVSVSAGVKSQNLRFGGGRVVSENAVLVTTGTIEYDSGFYGRFFSTVGANEYDAELDIGGGFVGECLGTFRCRVEGTYWVLPNIDDVDDDAVNLAIEISRTYPLADGQSLAFAARFEDLTFFGPQDDTEIFRVSGNYVRPVAGVPIRFFAEYDYSVARDWAHLPVGISARFNPSWLPEGVSITPSLEFLIPLNHRDERETGVAFGLTLGRTR